MKLSICIDAVMQGYRAGGTGAVKKTLALKHLNFGAGGIKIWTRCEPRRKKRACTDGNVYKDD